jgi:hypothetical protein
MNIVLLLGFQKDRDIKDCEGKRQGEVLATKGILRRSKKKILKMRRNYRISLGSIQCFEVLTPCIRRP